MYFKMLKKNSPFRIALQATVPVLLGYSVIGIAFGLLVKNAGLPWYIAPLMSIFIYAGAMQFIAISLFIADTSLAEIAVMTMLMNMRHIVYGLSLIKRFQFSKRYNWYLIFGLTDETYGLLTTISEPQEESRKVFYLYVTALNHLYWITGAVAGTFLGSLGSFNTRGVDFALTALFIVLMIEQYRNCRNKIPFLIALVCSVSGLVLIGPKSMLPAALAGSAILLLLFKKRIQTDEHR